MGNQKTSGLTKRGGIWHIDKQFRGIRIRESAATSDLPEAVALLAKRIEAIRKAQLYGVRQERTFRAAATKYLQENQQKRSLRDDVAGNAAEDQAVSGNGCPETAFSFSRGAGDSVSGTAVPPPADGVVQGECGEPRRGSVQPQVGMGAEGA